MKRRDFLKITGLSAAFAMVPGSALLKPVPGSQTIFDEFWTRTRWMPLSYLRTELNGVAYNAPKMQVRAPMRYSEEQLMHDVKYQFISQMIHGQQGFPSHGIPSMTGMIEMLKHFPTANDEVWPVATMYRHIVVDPISDLGIPGYQYVNIAGFVTTDPAIQQYPKFRDIHG